MDLRQFVDGDDRQSECVGVPLRGSHGSPERAREDAIDREWLQPVRHPLQLFDPCRREWRVELSLPSADQIPFGFRGGRETPPDENGGHAKKSDRQ